MSGHSSIIVNWELLGGSLCIKTMVNSIRTIVVICYIVGGCSWKAPLWEVSLCLICSESPPPTINKNFRAGFS